MNKGFVMNDMIQISCVPARNFTNEISFNEYDNWGCVLLIKLQVINEAGINLNIQPKT